jgi:hypothetical protein
MLVHTVLFYLRPGLTPDQRGEFRRDGLESLRPITSLAAYYVGRPATTPPRAVVDAAYDFAITCVFADLAAHDAYQTDPRHLAFVARFKDRWLRVQIYDADDAGLT